MSRVKEYIIYKIKCKDECQNFTYVGHTINFDARKSIHKSDCNREHHANYNFPIYQCIRANGGWDNWEMIPIEKLNCELMDAKIREQYHIENQTNKLNVKSAFITEEDANKNASITSKKYQEKNKEQIKEQRKEFRENNKIKLAEDYSKWYEQNKEKRRIYNAEYQAKAKAKRASEVR